MSITIQKKRFNKNSSTYTKTIAQFEQNDSHYQQYLKNLTDFETAFRKSSGKTTLKSLKGVLEGFYKQFKSDEFFLTDLSKHGDPSQKANENLFLINKTSDIVNLIADYIVNRKSFLVRDRKSFDLLDIISSETRDVTLLCVKILKLFAIINTRFANILANKPGFCIRMFEFVLQDNKVYFKQVLGIQEALIASNSQIINSSIYPYMQEALVHMPKKYFARFSRIIALLVLENSDKMDFRELPSEFVEARMVKVHNFLLGIPELIETYAIILEYLKEIMERLISTKAQNLRKSLRYLKESNLIKDSGLNLSFLKPLFEQSQFSESLVAEIFMPKFIVKFMVKKSNLTEIMFIMSNLLSGKRKIEVQNRLRQLNFMERVVNPLFDLLFHPELENGNHDDVFYSDDCNSNNPLATTRIQLLRIIINFCDRDSPNISNKEMLLSPDERNILYHQLIPGALKVHHPSYNGGDELGRDQKKIAQLIGEMRVQSTQPTESFFTEGMLKKNIFDGVEKKGLLNKITSLFVHFHPNSNYRFWLASCVEAFLRGFHEPHQIFVAHTGILYNLVSQILGNNISKASHVQISYDLVGEILKFNKYNFIFFENICQTFHWTYKLATHSLQNVVDSNVYLRALLLSFERFDYIDQKAEIPLSESPYNFNQYLSIYQTCSKDIIKWFQLLVESVEANSVNQDNICCVNTTLIMAMFADQKDLLQSYINTIIMNDNQKDSKWKELLSNFRAVLDIWNRYYISKSKDSYSLEYTSSLPFYYYQNMKKKIQTLISQTLGDQ